MFRDLDCRDACRRCPHATATWSFPFSCSLVAVGSYDVDIFDSTTGTWTRALLSERRYGVAATSVGKLALFAGGVTSYDGSMCFVI